MRITSRGRYAVTALLDLALNGQDGPISLSEIADRQGLSLRYLEQIFCNLRRQGIVCSVRGAGGGYSLCECATRISVADIVAAVEGQMELELQDASAGPVHQALVAEFWTGLNDCMRDYLETATLASLCACANRCQPGVENPADTRAVP